MGLRHPSSRRSKTSRAWIRSNWPEGTSSRSRSWATVTLARHRPDRPLTSMSVARTEPLPATWSASHAAIDPPPAPASQHRQPAASPSCPAAARLTGSSWRSSAASRASSWPHDLANTYLPTPGCCPRPAPQTRARLTRPEQDSLTRNGVPLKPRGHAGHPQRRPWVWRRERWLCMRGRRSPPRSMVKSLLPGRSVTMAEGRPFSEDRGGGYLLA